MMPAEPRAATHALPEAGAKNIEAEVRRILEFIGEDPSRKGLQETPSRVARSLLELTRGYDEDPKAILGTVFEESYEEPVVVRDIEFWSLCEHHMLPFHGRATVAYIPQGRIVGLSKIARLVHCYARRLQVQERLTTQIADALDAHLAPAGVAVHVAAEHQCMSMRGVEAPALTETAAFRGAYKEPERRREFLARRA